ncbi:MAG: c-type cytochrome, partial [Caulobacteraceae bacterium]
MTIGVRGGAALLAILGSSALAGAAFSQGPRSGQAQVEAGQALYNARCASCHAADLGGHEGPALAGPNFQLQWSQRTPQVLSAYIKTRMSPAQINLTDDQSGDLTAFILSANGAAPAATAMAPSTAAISTLVKAAAPRAPQATAAAVPAAGAGGFQSTANIGQTGLTVKGEVKAFTPVTDAMLADPPAGDWLMVRRNYQAWSH